MIITIDYSIKRQVLGMGCFWSCWSVGYQRLPNILAYWHYYWLHFKVRLLLKSTDTLLICAHLGGGCLDQAGRNRYPRYPKLKISGDLGRQPVI